MGGPGAGGRWGGPGKPCGVGAGRGFQERTNRGRGGHRLAAKALDTRGVRRQGPESRADEGPTTPAPRGGRRARASRLRVGPSPRLPPVRQEPALTRRGRPAPAPRARSTRPEDRENPLRKTPSRPWAPATPEVGCPFVCVCVGPTGGRRYAERRGAAGSKRACERKKDVRCFTTSEPRNQICRRGRAFPTFFFPLPPPQASQKDTFCCGREK